METWSAGKAVLHGMGLEITRDFLFFDLADVLFKENESEVLLLPEYKDMFCSGYEVYYTRHSSWNHYCEEICTSPV